MTDLEEKMKKATKPEYIENQTNNNCQQFYGALSGCVFAMPGSTVHQHGSSETTNSLDTTRDQTLDQPLFRYISPFVTDEKERVHLHKVIVNLVTSGYGMSYICSELIKLDKADKLGLNTTIENQYNELVRLGLPKDEKGYSLRNYENYMSAAKEK